MFDLVLEYVFEIAGTILITLIGVGGTWLMQKIGKKQELANIAMAMEQVIATAKITVGELQQTVVKTLRETGDGPLNEADIAMLQESLLQKTMEKLSAPAMNLLSAANVDMKALITGAGEDWVMKMANINDMKGIEG